MTKARPPAKEHAAILSVAAANKWMEDAGGPLPIYSRAMAAAVQLKERATSVRALKARYKHLQESADALGRDCPGFTYSLGGLPLPMFDARAMSTEISLGVQPALSLTEDQQDQSNRLAIFLDRVFEDQTEDQLRVSWDAPSRKKASHGFLSVEAMIEREQLARVVADGVGQILELIPLKRSEVPIVAVAARVDDPAKQSGDALRDEFKHRADRWRQKPALVAKRLRKLAVGLVPLSEVAFDAAMRALFCDPAATPTDASTADVPRRGYLDENGGLVRLNGLRPPSDSDI